MSQSDNILTPSTWAEISLTALRNNYATVRDFVLPAAVCAVVKANAYGHGAVECAGALRSEGAKWFAVTSAEEGIVLRRAGISGRILLLRGIFRGEEDTVIQENLTAVVWDKTQLGLLEAAAVRLDKAQESVPVHLKLDTGMSRLGVAAVDLPEMIRALQSSKYIFLEGVLSHLASAEVIDAPDIDAQLSRFNQAISTINDSGLSPTYTHICNSAGMVARHTAWKEMVRPGISLYGYFMPSMSAVTGAADYSYELPVLPVLSWKTRVIALRQVGARQTIGYSAGYITREPAKIAVIAAGYADGLNRQLSNRGRVIIRKQFACIVGNVTMDMTMVDVTSIAGIEVGDEVILIGSTDDGALSINAWEHAAHAQTIPYEILCNISHRVRRIYKD